MYFWPLLALWPIPVSILVSILAILVNTGNILLAHGLNMAKLSKTVLNRVNNRVR